MMGCMLLAACGEPLECTTDRACGDEAYCLETRCYPVTLDGQFRQAYRDQILPIIKAECNCHGPSGERPWAFDHRPGFRQGNENFLKVEPWVRHRNALAAPEDIETLPIPLNRFAAGLCGFNHPGIHDPAGSKARLMDLWARDAAKGALEQDVRPVGVEVNLEVTPTRGTYVAGLPRFEREAFDRALEIAEADGYAAAMDAEIVPRVVGQCGCCHDQGGYFELGQSGGAGGVSGPAAADQNRRATMNFLGRRDTVSENVAVVRYGLGACMTPDCDRPPHPRIYSGPDDPRLQLLRAWVVEGPEPVLAPPTTPEPPVVADAGPPIADGAPPPEPADYRTVYVNTIAANLDENCSQGVCHGMAGNNPWTHLPLSGPDDVATMEANFAEMIEPLMGNGPPRVLPGDAANSTLVLYGAGENHFFDSSFADPRLRQPVDDWIASLPADFPAPPSPPPVADSGVDAGASDGGQPVEAASDAGVPSDGQAPTDGGGAPSSDAP